MPLQPLLAPSGVFSNPNALASVPAGGLLRANNLEIARDGILDSIRGLEMHVGLYDTLKGISGNVAFGFGGLVRPQVRRLGIWKNNVFGIRGPLTDQRLCFAAASGGVGAFSASWQEYTTNVQPVDASGPGVTNRFAQAAGALFITSQQGLLKMDPAFTPSPGTISSGGFGAPLLAGVPKATDPVSSALVASGTAVPTTNVVAYRVVFGIRDGSSRLLFGAPSGRMVVTNTLGTTANVTIVGLCPAGLTPNHFFQVYRSAAVTAGIVPSDELQLVYESPTGQLTPGNSYTFTDIAPDSQRGAALYTNPSQQGGLQTNEPPPLCREVVRWRNTLFCFNTTTKRRRQISLLGTGTGSLVAGVVLTLANTAYTAVLETATPSATQFRVYTSGTAAANIENTARGLIVAINASGGSIQAFYASAYNTPPGQILLEEKAIGGALDSNFYLQASSAGSAFSPVLNTPAGAGSQVFMPAERFPGRLYYSKDQNFEAFPIGNNVDLGDNGVDGLRLMPLRDSLIILKGDGAYRCTGYTPADFRFEELDTTAVLLAPESAVVLSNQVFGLFDQGVCSLSDGSGLQVLSRPIEDKILPLASQYPAQMPFVFGMANEKGRYYELHIPTAAQAVGMGEAWRYNTFTQAWTYVARACMSGVVGGIPSRSFYGYAANGIVEREKQTFTARDVQGQGCFITSDVVSGTQVGMNIGTGSPGNVVDLTPFAAVGDYLVQGSLISRITAVSASTGLTVADTLAWTVGAVAEVVKLPPLESALWAPATLGDPNGVKTVQDVLAYFEKAIPTQFTALYDVPTSAAELQSIIDTTLQLNPGILSCPPPAAAVQAQYISVGFQHQVLFEKISCLGMAALMRSNSERGNR